MAFDKDAFITALDGMSVMELNDLVKAIEEKFGVAFHPNYLREWLTKRRHTPQKPARRAKQRNPIAIAGWLVDEYPAVQKKLRPTAPTSC